MAGQKQKIHGLGEKLKNHGWANAENTKEKEKLNILAEKVKEINLSTSAKPKKI